MSTANDEVLSLKKLVEGLSRSLEHVKAEAAESKKEIEQIKADAAESKRALEAKVERQGEKV